ncbi:MAG TPA: Omp28-related outer membrane protein [Bacteroidia bacterium]|nr:Omp28-related outer membrane protein [Bacteroidia bacterium]
MKKLLVLSMITLFAFTGCKKETPDPGTEVSSVSTDYKAFAVEFTATWCPYCGTYGFPAFENMLENHKYKITALSIHPDDDIVDDAYPAQDEFEDFYDCGGYPSAGVNVSVGGYPSDNYFNGQINTATNANTATKAGVGIASSVSGNTMTVNTKTVFFADVAGKINLAVYLVEDNIINDQNTTSTTIIDAEHDNVFRGSAGNTAWGSTITTGATKGTKLDGIYTIAIPADVRNKANLHVVAVLFVMNPTTGKPTAVLNSNAL